MPRTSLEPAHTGEVLCVAGETYIALKWRSIRHCNLGIAHLYFLSFFLHMRRGNYGTGHSASTCSCKIARFSEHPRSIRRLITFPSFFPHAPLMPVSTRHNHHLVASYRNPPIRVFAAPPWMLSRTFHFTRKCGCTMARSIITPDQDGKKITVRIKLPADPCKRCLGWCLERAPRF